MKLRIIAGSHGGRLIDAPAGRRTRPTAERVREAWFSALGEGVVGARIADLFAGSGALGIEALSRGARAAHFVESDRRVLEVLRRNLSGLRLEDRATVHPGDAMRWLDRIDQPFDIVLADPPYRSQDGDRLLERFRDRPFATQFWLEHESGSGLESGAFWTRRYGDTQVSAFRREDAPGPATRQSPRGELA